MEKRDFCMEKNVLQIYTLYSDVPRSSASRRTCLAVMLRSEGVPPFSTDTAFLYTTRGHAFLYILYT